MFPPANEDLLPERSISYDFSMTQRMFENRLSATLSLFYTEGDNIIITAPIDGRPRNQNIGEFANKGVELSLNYRILNNLHANANYSYLHMDTPITGAPKNKFYTGLRYTPGKFTFGAGVQVIDDLYLSTGDNAEMSNYTLVNAQVAYRLVKWAELYVKGDNLLSKRYETMLGFPMPGAIFMGGVSLNF